MGTEVGRGDDEASLSSSAFFVVAIGASAGGLAAIKDFFEAIPRDRTLGMAFVLIQHLSPDHESLLTELVGRFSHLDVHEAEDGMALEAGRVYVIPVRHDLALVDGCLRLLEPAKSKGLHLPIDSFFRSMAEDRGERAVGIVLSGTGKDGSRGLRAIRGHGGMVMVQSPASAEHEGMPRSAIDTGLVDFVLLPSEMPARLEACLRADGRVGSSGSEEGEQSVDAALVRICTVLRDHTGHDFSQYKTSTLRRRIERRMVIQRIQTMTAYLRFLEQSTEEGELLFRDLLIGVTRFFRDSTAFECLRNLALPRLLADRGDERCIRCWVCGCSTGEEAYSLAISLCEAMDSLGPSWKLQIFATDVDAEAIEKARTGIFPVAIAGDLDPKLLARYFVAAEDGQSYRIKKCIRELVIFSIHDLLSDPPFSRLDLLSCRNLLIYLNRDLQRKVFPIFHYSLDPGGVLFLGTSETIGEFTGHFEVLDQTAKLYVRKELEGKGPLAARGFGPATRRDRASRDPAVSRKTSTTPLDFPRIIAETLQAQNGQAGALVTLRGDILHIFGRTGSFLEPAEGEITANILAMARDGLRRELTIALHRSVAQHDVVSFEGLRLSLGKEEILVDLVVHPAIASPDLFLVIFAQREDAPRPVAPSDSEGPEEDPTRIALLEAELVAKEGYLQATLEEMETSNEELKSSNEELQSVNEELQSSNEELETSKEELQSVNEELSTVNSELQAKLGDLSRVNDDMHNLLAGTGIGTLFVDLDLRISRFTPAIAKVINLIASDVGRPVSHFMSNLEGYDRLVEDVQEVLDSLIPREAEVRTRDGQPYLMRIQPYRTLENVIQGAVISFVDISEIKRLETALQRAHHRLCTEIVATVDEPLLVLNEGLQIVMANVAFCRSFRLDRNAVEGQDFFLLQDRLWESPDLRTNLSRLFATEGSDRSFRSSHVLKNEAGELHVHGHLILSDDRQERLVLLAVCHGRFEGTETAGAEGRPDGA